MIDAEASEGSRQPSSEAERAQASLPAKASATGDDEAERLSDVLGAIYDAALDPGCWPEALRLATGFLDGAAANLFWQDPINHQATVFQHWGDDPAFVESYFSRYAQMNPFFPAVSFVPVGVVFSGGDLIPHEEFALTRFYREWVAPQGFIDVVGVNLHRFAVGASAFSVRRSREQGIVDDAMRRRMGLLAPHMQRATLIGRDLEGQRSRAFRLEAVLHRMSAAVLVVDRSGHIDFANEAALGLLQAGDMIAKRDGSLCAVDRAADQSLRAAYAEAVALGNRPMIMPCPPPVSLIDGRLDRHLAHVLPASHPAARAGGSDRAIVLIRKAELPIVSSLEVMAKLHGLTASEVKVLEAVVGRGSAAEIAAALGIKVATVKTHLASLFAKTGTRRRSELVSAVAAHGQSLI